MLVLGLPLQGMICFIHLADAFIDQGYIRFFTVHKFFFNWFKGTRRILTQACVEMTRVLSLSTYLDYLLISRVVNGLACNILKILKSDHNRSNIIKGASKGRQMQYPIN